MEWQKEIENLYNNLVSKMPQSVQPIIGPLLHETCEKKCHERKGDTVTERDFVIALFEVTPPAVQPTMIEDLTSLGVDYNKWMVYVKAGFQHEMDLNQTLEDLKKIADFAGVECDEEAIWEVFNAYKDFFTGSSISIRTTSKPVEKRDVSIRYVELMMQHDPDPYITATKEGLIEKNGHPLHKMFYEIYDKFEMMGHGVDLDVSKGLTKIWSFMAPCPVDRIYTMETIPDSVKTLKDYFSRHGLNEFVLFALDFYHKTVNIYFLVRDPSKVKPEKYETLLKEVGFEPASREIMEKCTKATTLYYTFNWETNKVERVCFGVLCPEGAEGVPVHFHPIMKEFVEKAPFATDKRTFIYAITFSPEGHFYKIESDYNGTMIEILKMGAQGGLEL
ncbi:MAG: hypothetical protein GF317_16440 [Candidatus Lokiarchaeota archaeon]|nr:hypothetical protein [Candidatus Lokiarchaeota archaeon]MBD3201124.1 hypothetical protein [Candidatus Lokiarchaeota archaeon]